MSTKGVRGSKELFDTRYLRERKSDTRITCTNPQGILNQRPLSNASYRIRAAPGRKSEENVSERWFPIRRNSLPNKCKCGNQDKSHSWTARRGFVCGRHIPFCIFPYMQNSYVGTGQVKMGTSHPASLAGRWGHVTSSCDGQEPSIHGVDGGRCSLKDLCPTVVHWALHLCG